MQLLVSLRRQCDVFQFPPPNHQGHLWENIILNAPIHQVSALFRNNTIKKKIKTNVEAETEQTFRLLKVWLIHLTSRPFRCALALVQSLIALVVQTRSDLGSRGTLSFI